MTPAKKKPKTQDARGSDQLRKAIISQIREGESAGAPGGSPPASADRDSTGESQESLLDRRISILGPRLSEMAVFCRQFATLLDVGIPLVRSLQILSKRTEHPRLKQVVKEVADDVEQGNRLSVSLEKHPRIFSPLFVNVVKVGESGGILEGSVRNLADILENKASIRRRIVAAAAYPVTALFVALVILIGMIVVAIPRFVSIYEQMFSQQMNTAEAIETQADVIARLPGPTQTLINLSEFIIHRPAIYIPVVLALLAVLYLFRRSVMGKRFFDWSKLTVPVFAAVNRKIAIARTTRTVGGLVTAGIPLLETLKITAEGSENVLVAESIDRVREKVESGGRLEEQLREEKRVFPPLVVDMIAIGDEGGALDVVLNKLAETYDEEVDSTLRGLTAIVEPLLIVILGALVLFIAVALLLPYYTLATKMAW